MGPSVGNGVPGMELGMGMHGNGANQLHATEYTLQGVMRFLQSEWHRHERDRNAWDIERQEMRGRIANLASQVRRADATQKALRRYTTVLEQRLRDQAARSSSGPALDAALAAKNERAAKIQEKLQCERTRSSPVHLRLLANSRCSAAEDDFGAQREDGLEGGEGGDELRRHDLKTFLDQCQVEFMYLMASPANPRPPRDYPPLPMMEDLREADAFGIPGQPPMDRQYHLQRPAPHLQDYGGAHARLEVPLSTSSAPSTAPPSYVSNPTDFHPHLIGRSPREQQPSVFLSPHDRSEPLAMAGRSAGDSMAERSFTGEAMSEMGDLAELRDKPLAGHEPDGWAFPEGAFPEPLHPQPPPPPTPPTQSSQLSSHRPDTDVFPNTDQLPKSPKRITGSHRRKGSMSRRRSVEHDLSLSSEMQIEGGAFKLRFGLRGHLETVRSVIFSGGGSPGEPEICTTGDDGMIKCFNIPRLENHPISPAHAMSDLDVVANFTHRGHSGSVLSLASWSSSPSFSTGGRVPGDGWIFSGGQDATVRVWERGRVDPKATLEGHTDAVWALCVLPATLGAVFGNSSPYGSADRILLVSGAADGSVRLWSVSAPPQLSSPQPGSNRSMSGRGGRVRGNSMSSGSGFPSSPQPTVASNSPFHYTLVHIISRLDGSKASPTCVSALGPSGETFVVSYSDAAVIVYDTASGEQVGQMDSMETFDGTVKTSVNAVVAATIGLDQGSPHHGSSLGGEEEAGSSGPTGGRSMAGSGVEGTIISGHEDRFVRFFDANNGQCTYNMLAHPDAISSLSLSPDGRELVSAGHDASLRFWSLEKRTCVQEMTSHRIMRGEGVCSCIWSHDGKWVVSGGGDSVVKVYAR